VNLKDVGREIYWIDLIQYRHQWRALANIVTSLLIP
jgi:hypothetical protein